MEGGLVCWKRCIVCYSICYRVCGEWALFAGVLEELEAPEAVCYVLPHVLEAVEGELCLREEQKMMRCVLLCMLKVVEDRLCFDEGVAAAGGGSPCAAPYAGGCGG